MDCIWLVLKLPAAMVVVATMRYSGRRVAPVVASVMSAWPVVVARRAAVTGMVAVVPAPRVLAVTRGRGPLLVVAPAAVRPLPALLMLTPLR